MRLRLSSDFVVDTGVEPWSREGLRVAMLGGPGSGKSWNNSLIAEQFLEQGGTVVIFQPRDEYFTLKEKFDVLSVGGVHAKDMEFALTSPSIYAKAVVEDGISMIFYTSAVDDEAKLIDWVSRFISQVLKLQEKHKRPLLLILEEAHEYTPKSPSGHVAPPWIYNRMVKAFKDCFTQGRKLNIIAVASSQRPQELNFTVRQLANLSFYGKFSAQDIKYVDSECLKYVRKQFTMKENEVVVSIIDASRLLDLQKGEWLVIAGKDAKFIHVTHPRVTHHGAETPRLEYVAPRPTEVKKTIDELSKSIAAALEKEEGEASELEKSRRKIRDLETKLEEQRQKANIKLSMKEMMEGGAGVQDSVHDGVEVKALKAELDEFRSGHKLAESVQGRLKYLAEVKLDLEKRMKSMEDALKDYDDLRGILSRALRVQNIYDNIHRAEERLEKKIPTGIPTAGLLPAGEAAVGLQKVKTVVAIQEVSVSVPTIRTDTVKGKILALARDASFFDSWKSVKEISAALVDEYRFNASDQAINGALKEIVDQQILGVKYTDRNRWKLSPDVVFEAKKEAS